MTQAAKTFSPSLVDRNSDHDSDAALPLAKDRRLRILFVTSQWPSQKNPGGAIFVKREAEAVKACGVDLDLYIYEGGWSIAPYIKAIREMRRRIRHGRPDIIHARFGQCGIVARAQWQVPVVITYGGSDIEGYPMSPWRCRYRTYLLPAISRLLSLFVDEVIVVADHLGRKLPRKDYHVIPSGIDLTLFRPIPQAEARTKLGLPMARWLVLFVGNPANGTKRYALAAQACKLANASVDLELVALYGKPSEEVPLYMSACDVLLLTSTNEGSPNVVKEALACNLPVVSVDVGDVRERIQYVDGCVLCDRDDPQQIAYALEKVLLRNSRLDSRKHMEYLNSMTLAKQIINVYQCAAQSRSG